MESQYAIPGPSKKKILELSESMQEYAQLSTMCKSPWSWLTHSLTEDNQFLEAVKWFPSSFLWKSLFPSE